MKKQLLLLVMMMTMVALADAIEINGIHYSLMDNVRQAEVIRAPDKYTGHVVIPESITYKGLDYSVTSIRSCAFLNSDELISVTIPSTIEYIGSSSFKGCKELTSVTIPNSVAYLGDAVFENCTGLTSIIIGHSVTSIGLFAFSGCTNLTSICIPNSVKTIKSRAFENCKNLRSVIIGESVTFIGNYAFYNCTGISSVSIPNSVTIIDDYAFRGCTSLNSVVIPNSVTTIGGGVFYDCSNMNSVSIPSTVKIVGHNPYMNTAWYNNLPNGLIYKDNVLLGYKGNEPTNSLEILEGTRIIAGSALNSCSGLTSVIIPNTVTSIGSFAFYACKGLTSISIPNSVTSIEDNAFYFCSNLKSVSMGNSVMSIGLSSFASCPNLSIINIPNSVISIGTLAFNGCGLTTIAIPHSVTSIGNDAFINTPWFDNLPNGLIYKDNVLLGYKGDRPENVLEIKDGTRVIASAALIECENLTSVIIPNTVISIGEEAFRNCRGLKQINLPYSIKSIENETFEGCSGLSSITIPNSITSIGDGAFFGCSNIDEVISFIEQPFPIDHSVFQKNSNFERYFKSTLYVPKGTNNIYHTTEGWKEFVNIETIGIPEHLLKYIVDGNEYKKYSIEEGATILPEADPEKEGYTFSGWSEIPVIMPDHDVTVTGSFTIDKYKLIYTIDGEVYKSSDVEYGTSITPESAPQKEGYTFSGWSEIPQTMPAHDVTVTGSFTINKYMITYMVNNVELKKEQLEYGATITPPATDNEGHEIMWNSHPTTMPAYDITIYGSVATGIESISADNESVAIFSIEGKQLSKYQKGLNIVKYPNGQIRKVVVK